MASIGIKGGTLINEGKSIRVDLVLTDGFITDIRNPGQLTDDCGEIIDATGKWIIPGIIDDQVHFRQPGLETKGTIGSESKAAVAGGITSFMDMPNTIPPTVTHGDLEVKEAVAEKDAWCNYSFYLGATNNNIREIRNIDPGRTCGIKVFMGSSTGNLLVDDVNALEAIFTGTTVPIAVHSEDEDTIRKNLDLFREKYADNPDPAIHPLVRSREACVKCTERAISLSEKTGGHLHLLHISTAEEVEMIRKARTKGIKVTAEVCVHHLFFTEEDYILKGNLIKWNPAIKTTRDRDALIKGLRDGIIDIVATDHAPHEYSLKIGNYFSAPSGGPMVEHSLLVMLELADRGLFSVTDVVKWMAHSPADLFRINKRGYIRTGYHADIVLVNPNASWRVKGVETQYLVKWSPLEELELKHRVETTIVNGKIVFNKGTFRDENRQPMPLVFER